MAWIYLLLGGFCEVAFATCLKNAENFTKWHWSLGFLFFAVLSFVFLNKAAQTIPIGTAYAVWTGSGALLTVLMGILYFNEPVSALRIFFIVLLISGIVGLKAVS